MSVSLNQTDFLVFIAPNPQQHSILLMSENCRPHPPATERPPKARLHLHVHFLFLSLCQSPSPQVWSDPILTSLNDSHLPSAQSKPGSHRDTGLFLPSYVIRRRGLQVLRLNSPGIHPLLSTCIVTTLTQTVSTSWLAHSHFFLRLRKPNFSKCNAPSPACPCPWETDWLQLTSGYLMGSLFNFSSFV